MTRETTPIDAFAIKRVRAEKAVAQLALWIADYSNEVPTWDRVAIMSQAADLLELTRKELEGIR